MDMENRQHRRFPLRMPVLCESPTAGDYRILGITQNVSQSGLLVEAVLPLSPGTWTGLRLLAGDLIAQADAEVVWTAEGRMGLRFTGMTEPNSAAWNRLLTLLVGRHPRTSVRIPIHLEVTCVIPPDTRLRGRAENLSHGGILVVLLQTVPTQTRVRLKVPGVLGLAPIEADVVWTRANAAEHEVVHGLRFLEEDMGKELFLIDTLLRQFLE